jgi:acetylserotonin O-methyltransferase
MSATVPDASPLLDIMEGFRKSKTLFVLVQLGLPDILESGGALSVADIAPLVGRGPAGACPDGVLRLLAAACSLGIIAEMEGKFSNTPLASTYLVSSSPASLCGYILHSDKLLYPLWSGLQASVEAGQCCWQHATGKSQAEAWAEAYKTPEDTLRFMKGMHSFACMSATNVAVAFDLSQHSTLVDLGGGTGALAVGMCRQYPNISATVVDLPAIVALARDTFTKPPYLVDSTDGLVDRIAWQAADFFTEADRLPTADIFLLARIIHDWDDRRAAQILKAAFDKLHAGGTILVCEMLLDDDGLGPPSALLQSLNMLVGWHGRERTLQQYRELLAPAGFVNIEARRTGQYLDVIKAEKPRPGAK